MHEFVFMEVHIQGKKSRPKYIILIMFKVSPVSGCPAGVAGPTYHGGRGRDKRRTVGMIVPRQTPLRGCYRSTATAGSGATVAAAVVVVGVRSDNTIDHSVKYFEITILESEIERDSTLFCNRATRRTS